MPRSSRSCSTPDKIQPRSCPDYVQIQALWHGKENDLIEVRGAPNYSIDDVVTDKKADEKKRNRNRRRMIIDRKMTARMKKSQSTKLPKRVTTRATAMKEVTTTVAMIVTSNPTLTL